MQKLLGVNWKTTLGGIGTIATAVGTVITMVSQQGLTPEAFAVLGAGLTTGIALICAKDGNTTGAGPTATKV